MLVRLNIVVALAPTDFNTDSASVYTCILFFSDSSKEPLQDSWSRAWAGRRLDVTVPRIYRQFGKARGVTRLPNQGGC